MKKEQLLCNTCVTWVGSGTYKVEIYYRKQYFSCLSHNSLAYDRLKDNTVLDRVSKYGYTYKGALASFWNECKRKNNL